MEGVLTSGEEWRVKGIRRAADFSWAWTARSTREVYAEAIRRFKR
jgi:hypothetical protein